MEDLRTVFRTHVLQQSAISLLISNRLHVDRLPQNASYPCIRMVTVSDIPRQTHSSVGFGSAVYQLDCYSESTIEASSVALALRQIYDGYRGSIGERFDIRILVKAIPGVPEPDERLFRRTIEMDIGYVEKPE